MVIEFLEITLGLITASLLVFLLYGFLNGSKRRQASQTRKILQTEQFREFEQEFGEDDQEDEFDDLDAPLKLETEDPLDTPQIREPAPEVTATTNHYQEEPVITEEPVVAEQHDDSVVLDSKTRIISVYILANAQRGFSGYDLLQSLLAAGLRFGEMNIFHRHEESNGSGRVLFSLASATEPGTFDIQNMGSFNGRGLCLFMQVQGNDKDSEVFDLFIKTAQKLSDELNGSIYDDSRHPLTKDSLLRFQRIMRAAKKESEPFELA